MGLLDRLLGNDHERTTRYDGPSASETTATKRRTGHRRSVTKTARAGQAWEEQDRQQHPSTTRWFRRER